MIRHSILKEITETIVGKDCRYEDKYLETELEIDKISSVTQEIPNFRQIIENCEYLLSTHTKDFKLISWWFYSNFKINKIDGLNYSIDCFKEFINKFYSSFYPKSNNLRSNIIDWLEINFLKDLQNDQNLIDNFKKDSLYEDFLQLSSILSKVTENDKEYLKDVIKLIKPTIIEIVNNLEEKNQKEIKAEDKIVEQIKEVVEQNIDTKISEILTESDSNKVFRDFKKSAFMLSKYYRSIDFSSFKSLRINRFMFLLEFEDLPISNGKRTSIYPPLITDIELIDSLMRQNKNSEVLILAEEILEDCPFWLDGHFYTYHALLNTNMIKQAEEVKSNLINLIDSNKEILNLTFIEDTPFVTLKTKNWLEKEKKEKKEKVVLKVNVEQKEDNFFEDLDNLISNKSINETINIFQEKINLSKNFEEKFNLRLKFSEFILNAGKKEIGMIFLEELVTQIKHFNLLDWNPKLASKVYSLILNNFSISEYGEEQIEVIYKNLCKIDANSAFEINLN